MPQLVRLEGKDTTQSAHCALLPRFGCGGSGSDGVFGSLTCKSLLDSIAVSLFVVDLVELRKLTNNNYIRQ